MFLDKLRYKKIRFFLLQSNDMGMVLFKEFYFGYLLNLLIDKLGFKLKNISVEIVFPFKKYLNLLYKKIFFFDEDVYIFYLENSYHSNVYGYEFLIYILEKIKNKKKIPEIYIYSLKIGEKESKEILLKYPFVKLVIRTDIEYFFNEYFYKKISLENIGNLILNINGKIIETNKENVDYNLDDYILGGHYTGYLNKFQVSKDYIINILDDDENTDNLITYKWPKEKKILEFRYNPELIAMLSTGKGCKYNCSYCYRGVKYSKVRQISLKIIKKDLDYLKNMYYEEIYLYDDCFLTTNKNRLDEILDLLGSYNFYYGISIRYEACDIDILEKLKKINLYRVQIGLQSISINSNIITGRGLDIEKFKKVVNFFIKNKVNVSIDLILGLPGEKLSDFIKTFNFAVSINPKSIHINTLFLNPGTKLNNEKDIYGIKINENKKGLFSVPTVIESNSFSKKDMMIAKIYIEKVSFKCKNINIILR